MASILTKVAATDLMPTILAPTKDDFDFPPDAKARDAMGEAVPMTIDYESGRAYGTVAPWGRCLLDGSGTCWTPPGPESDDLSLSMQGLATLQDGTKVAVGVLPFDQNHANHTLSGEGAIDAMAHSGRAFLRCRYFAGVSGICAAGVILPGVTYGDAVRIEAAATSGDWRALWRPIHDEGGHWRFTGAIVVNVPGLPLDTSRTVAETQAMYARAASARFANHEVVFSDMTDDLVSIGWAHTAATGGDPKHSKEVQEFLQESRRLTDQVKAEREAIHNKYQALLEQLGGVKVEAGKHNRTDKRIQIRQQRSAELTALREKTKATRQALAEKRKTAVEELRTRQRAERQAFSDKARADRKALADGGQTQQGQVMEGFRNRAKALQKRYADLREQIRQEFADRSDAIKDLDKDAKPAARQALADARRKKNAELRDRYAAEREALAAERAKALETFRVENRAKSNELSDRQRAEREKAKQGAATMPDPVSILNLKPGQAVTLLDGTVARVASLADLDGATMLVTDDGRVVDEFEVDADAKTAGCLYRFTNTPRLAHNAEVVFPGGRGLVCGMAKTADGADLVEVRRINDDGTVAGYEDEVVVPAADCTPTGRVAEYVGHEDSDGIEIETPDRVVDGPLPTPAMAQVAAAGCSCKHPKTAAMDPAGNMMPDVADPTAQIALEKADALEQRMSDLEAKLDVLVRAKQEADLNKTDAVMASLRSNLSALADRVPAAVR